MVCDDDRAFFPYTVLKIASAGLVRQEKDLPFTIAYSGACPMWKRTDEKESTDVTRLSRGRASEHYFASISI